MALANQEAKRLNHEYIGTEHMLMGIVKEGTGVGASVLKNLGVDLERVRHEVEKLVRPGPDALTFGKLPMVPRCKQVIEHAIEEARQLNHRYVGTEHLLLGLLREHEGVAANVLLNIGVGLDEVRNEIIGLLGVGEPLDSDLPPDVTQPAGAIWFRAAEVAAAQGDSLRPEHLLIALARCDSRASALLRDAGLTPERIEQLLRE